jgi:hypothetical protein
MKTTKFSDLKRYYKLSSYDINRTNINSREDKYQDAVLARLEKENEDKIKKSKKQTKTKYNAV